MADKKHKVVLELTAAEHESVRRALRELGEEGERLSQRLERAGDKGAKGLKTVNTVAGGVSDGMRDAAGSAGIFGDVLSDLGLKGIAAAAAVGGLVLAYRKALSIAQSATMAFSALGDQSDRLGLSAETFQTLRVALGDLGDDANVAWRALTTLNERANNAAQGTGELASRLRETHPELVRQLASVTDNGERLRILERALKGAADEVERDTILYAAFGAAGKNLGRVFLENEGSLADLTDTMRAQGRVLSDELIDQTQDWQLSMDKAAAAADRELKVALVELTPILVEWKGLLTDIIRGFADLTSAFRSVDFLRDDQLMRRFRDQSETLARVYGVDESRIDELLDFGGELSYSDLGKRGRGVAGVAGPSARDTIDSFNATLDELRRREEEVFRRDRETYYFALDDEAFARERAALESQFETVQADIARMQAEIEANGRIAGLPMASEAQLRALQSARRFAGLKEAELDVVNRVASRRVAVDPYAKDEESAASRVAAENNLNALRREAARLLIEQNDITLATTLAREELAELEAENLLTTDQVRVAMAAATLELEKQTPAYQANMDLIDRSLKLWQQQAREIEQGREEAARFMDGERRAGVQFDRAYASPEEARQASREDLSVLANNAAAAGAPLSDSAVDAYLREVEEAYQRAEEAASAYLGTQREVEYGLNALIEGTASFGDVARNVARQFIREFLGVDDAITSVARSFRGFLDDLLAGSGGLGGLISGLFGGLFGGVGTPGITGPIPQSHTGAGAFAPAQWRDPVRSPLMDDERLAVIRRDQSVVGPGAAAPGGGIGQLVINAPGADRGALEAVREEVRQLDRRLMAGMTAVPRMALSAVRGEMAVAGRL